MRTLTSFNNDLDVTQRVQTTEAEPVRLEINRIFLELHPSSSTRIMEQGFSDVSAMYLGNHPGYLACDTPYHDIQHVLDVTLAMARLIDGYERSRARGALRLGERLFQLGVMTALFHDIGYIRERDAKSAQNGAQYTRVHVSRGAEFLKRYLPTVGMAELAEVAAGIIHFTGYEIPVGQIPVRVALHRMLGNLLGSADIVAQMADRCYLEKCRDRLYPEFVEAGIARRPGAIGDEQVIFTSGDDLVMKTPAFFLGASRRLDDDLAAGYSYAEKHFGGQNLYLDELGKNIKFAEALAREGDASALRRVPPDTLSAQAEPQPEIEPKPKKIAVA